MIKLPTREDFERLVKINTERNEWNHEYYAHLPVRQQWKAWQVAIAEVQRLNATAQPVSDGWVSLLTDRQRSVINFALYRFMNDAYSNASIVAQDKRLDSSMVDTFTADARDAESLMSEITSYRDNLAAAPGGQDD